MSFFFFAHSTFPASNEPSRLLMKARQMTYTIANVRSAFAATGISPVNESRVLDRSETSMSRSVRAPSAAGGSHRVVPATPGHGRAIMIHGRRTLKVLPRQTPTSKYSYAMVEKLLKAAEKATAENVILSVENANLRRKATAAEDRQKTRSRKELSKAQVITAEDVVRIRREQEGREQVAAERKARAVLKQAQASSRGPADAIPKTATPRSPRGVRGSNKRQGAARKVVMLESPIAIDSGESEWGGIDSEWESGDSDGGLEGAEDTIAVQPAARTLRSTTRGQASQV